MKHLYEGIKFTGNPLRLLGIYIGHKKEKVFESNWLKKLDKIKSVIDLYKKFNISYYGRVEIIKRFALSKIVFPATMLVVPEEIIKTLNTCFFEFLWGSKKDRLSRNITCIKQNKGSLGMIDVKHFCDQP